MLLVSRGPFVYCHLKPQSVRKVAVTGARQRECELREVDPLPELLLWVGMQSVQAGGVNREVDRR
jgi:hypothetical protein